MPLLEPRAAFKPFEYEWAYEAWLVQNKVHWLPEEIPLAEDVKDWQVGVTEPERNLLTQIFRFFTQADVEVGNCFAAGTEILTPHGWRDFRSLTEQSLVAQVNKDLTVEFVKPIKLIEQKAPTSLLRLHSPRGVDVTVTPDHDMVVVDSKGVRKVSAAKYTKNQNVRQPLAARLAHEGEGLAPRERLLIAYQADAKTTEFKAERKSHGRLEFSLKKGRKLDRLAQTLDACGYASSSTTYADGRTVVTCEIEGAFGLGEKDFSWVDLSKVGARWCREFIEELSHWDAWVSPQGAVQYRTTNERAADIVQAVASLAGYKSKKVANSYDYQSAHWLVAISRKQDSVTTKQVDRSVVATAEGDTVHCVTVPSGMVLVRSNGMPVVSGNCYMRQYSQVFRPVEVLMMLTGFANIECVHMAAYSHLLDTVGMPALEYQAFLDYKAMKDKYDYMQSFNVASKRDVAKTLAAFGAFTEGLQLFASFAILLNFPRRNKMKGMGQVITWSVRDETLHCLSIIRLFRTFIQENPEVWTQSLVDEIVQICRTMVEHEDAFIDLAFEMGPVDGLSADEVKAYIRYIADRRLVQLGIQPIFAVEKNPLPWLDDMLNAVEHTNFFENRATEYSRASTAGSWEEAFDGAVFSTSAFGAIGGVVARGTASEQEVCEACQ